MKAISRRLLGAVLASALSLRCWALDPSSEPVQIVEVVPATAGDRDELRVVLSRPVAWIEPGGGLDVWVADESVPHFVRLDDGRRALLVQPDPKWPAWPELGLRLRPGLVGEAGEHLDVDTSTRAVGRRVERAPDPTPRVSRMAPASGHAAPSNLRWLGLIVEPPRALSGAALRQRDDAWALLPEGARDGRVRVRLAEDGPRRPGIWTLSVPEGFELSDGLDRQVDLAPTPDLTSPRIEAWSYRVEASAVVVHLEADEAFFVRGSATTASGTEVQLDAPPYALRTMSVRVPTPLPSTLYEIEIELVDLSGNAVQLPAWAARSAPKLAVEITEVVTTPLRDWGDSEEAGRPFDPLPGSGSVTDADEWVELVNHSGRALDLRTVHIQLETMDGTPAVTQLSDPPAAYFGAGGDFDRWLPGEALVVRPRGSMSSRDLKIRVVSGDVVLDDIRLAEEAGEHPGGTPPDSVHEAIAKSSWGTWAWCRPTPGDAASSSDCLP